MIAIQRKTVARSIVIIMTVLLTLTATRNAVVNASKDRNPDLALSIDPHNARALAVQSDIQLSRGSSSFNVDAMWQSATMSLRAQALAAKSLRQAAMAAEMRRDGKRSAELMTLSNDVSRQESGTQLWLVNKAVAENDIPEALVHYDIALRSSDTVRDVLFPTLLVALQEPEVRTSFARLIKSHPPWMESFLLQSIADSPSAQVVASAVNAAGGLPKDSSYRAVEIALLNRLIDQHHVVEARQLYDRLEGHDPERMRSTAFGRDSEIKKQGNMGWQLFSAAAAGAEWLSEGTAGKRRMQVYAGSEQGGHVARKILYIEPGAYRLGIRFGETAAAANAVLRWELRCAEDDSAPSVWEQREPLATIASARTYDFKIDRRCAAYFLNLFVEGGSSQDGLSVVIDSIALNRQS